MKSCLQISVFLTFCSFLLLPRGLPSNRSFQGIGPATEMRTGLLTHPAVSFRHRLQQLFMLSLLILLILPARPPRQLELAKMWAGNWSMGGKVSNGLILNSKRNVACCTAHPRVHVFPFHSGWMLWSCLITVRVDHQRGLTRLHGVVSTRRETRCLTNSNQMEETASDLQCAAGTKSFVVQTRGYQNPADEKCQRTKI